MNKNIVVAFLVSMIWAFNALGYEAYVHNCTGYNLKVHDWKTVSILCKDQHNIDLPKNTMTTISWGSCFFAGARFAVTIGNTLVSDILKTDETTYGSRHWFIYAEQPILRVEMPSRPGTFTESSKFVRFYLWVAPSGLFRGGLYAVSHWYDTITGRLADADAKAAGLDIVIPEITKEPDAKPKKSKK